MKFSVSNKPLAAFSFSSLTDIVMLLLIFFLLSSQFVLQTGVKVQLPSSKNNEQSIPTSLIVTVTPEGQVYIGEEPTTMDELPAKLEILKNDNPENTLILRADKVVPIDLVIQVIDRAKGVGIDKFTLETEKKPE